MKIFLFLYVFFSAFQLNAQRIVPKPSKPITTEINENNREKKDNKTHTDQRSHEFDPSRNKHDAKLKSIRENLSKFNFSQQKKNTNIFLIEDVLPRTDGKLQVEYKTNVSSTNKGNFFDIVNGLRDSEYESLFLIDYSKVDNPFFTKLFNQLKDKNFFLLNENGETERVYCVDDKFFRDFENFRIEIQGGPLIPFDINKQVKKKLSANGNFIISLISNDTYTENRITKIGTKQASTIKNGEEELFQLLEYNKNKNIFIVGHIENNQYVSTNHLGETLFSIDIQKIDNFVKKNKSSIFVLGCSSITNNSKTGFTTDVNSDVIIDDVIKCFDALKLKDIYNTLSNKEKGYIFYVKAEHIEDDIHFTARIHKEQEETEQKGKETETIINSIAYSQVYENDNPAPTHIVNPNDDNSSKTLVVIVFGFFVIGFLWILALVLDIYDKKRNK